MASIHKEMRNGKTYVGYRTANDQSRGKVRAHFSTGVFLDGEVVYMLMDEGAA